MTDTTPSKKPTPDRAEHNAFFPSPYSLDAYTSPVAGIAGDDYPAPYTGKRKVLVICSDERYLPTDNGTLFSTGNHPVETLVPMHHMHKAGFDFDIATLSGLSVKFEMWAMPHQDQAVMSLHRNYLDKFRTPLRLADVVARLDAATDYIAVFIPGGHGALIGLPDSADVAAVINWALAHDRHLVSICHGPAAFLAAGVGTGENPLKGYTICAFPDAADRQTPAIGYMPGGLTWFFGEKLAQQGLTLLNTDVTGATHQDRKVITGDSPFAANALGRLAARALLDAAAQEGEG